MIRFINIGDQIDDKNRFAFYDTTTDKFCEFNGSQSWDNVSDFEKDFEGDDIDRYKRLINHNWRIVVDDIDRKLDNTTSNFMEKNFSFISGNPWRSFPPNSFSCGRHNDHMAYLNKELKTALEIEDYLKADDLKKQIEALRNGLQKL